MEELDIQTSDILHLFKRRRALNVKREWHPEYETWHYRISGKDPEGSILTVVVAILEADNSKEGLDKVIIITVFYQR
jgi:hypothetical protein